MPIQVVCHGCKTAFQVSEKFAGKKGPCPKCKAIITIPMPKATDEIKIHAPAAEGPKDTAGRPVFMPILRQETKISRLMIGASVGGGLAVLLFALILRLNGGPPPIFLILGAIALAPPLGVAGYAMFRDQELEPYRGQVLWTRVAISSVIYAALWAVFYWVPQAFGLDFPYAIPEMLFIVPPIVAVGGFAGYLIYDVEVGTGFLHYGMYLAVTTLLAWIANVPFLNNIKL